MSRADAVFKLRFPEREIAQWAGKYSYPDDDGELANEIRPAARSRGYLMRVEFLKICNWKTKRSRSRCAKNDERTVRVLTTAAFSASDEALKMDLLRMLHGVEWPTASTLLHFCDAQPYPILDYRALWSLGFSKPPTYTMDFWLRYLAFTRELASRSGLPIKTVDRALWQYSKTHQRVGGE